jgi:nitroreductase
MSEYSNDFSHILTTTRSVRKRLDFSRDVDISIIDDCLTLALQAPTCGHVEDWRWIVVSDEELKKELGQIYLQNFIEYVRTPLLSSGPSNELVKGRLGGVKSGEVDSRTTRMLEGAAYLAENIHLSPFLVIPCASRPNPEFGGSGTISAVYGSVYPAIWSFQLALRSKGLGSVITSLHLHSAGKVAELLSIPDGVTQVAMLPVAYTIGTDFKVAARKNVEEVRFMNRWSQ